jgi:branched-chain amino acid transport system permease protein
MSAAAIAGARIQKPRFTSRTFLILAGMAVIGTAAPFVEASLISQMTLFWIMVIMSYTWDTMGGQMGYNSFGNVVFFGIGMYLCAIIQVGLYQDVAVYNAAKGGLKLTLTHGQYFTGLAIGLAAAGVAGFLSAAVIGSGILGLRGHYFAIGTLALGIFFAEMASGWDYIGAGSGMVPPPYPGTLGQRGLMFYYMCFILAGVTFLALQWLYSRRFGLALNAIRDDEDKAEAMGLHTVRYKTIAWAISGFFLGICGGLVGNFLLFIDPRDTAFSGATYGVWMVLMVVLGGKGTFWGPLIGALLFHAFKELFWSYLLGLQYIALGLLVVVIVVFFPEGIVGWFRERFPHWFGERVEPAPDAAPPGTAGEAAE